MRLGNDIVDWAAPAARGKVGDARFVRRVFTPRETAWIHAAPEPERTLWAIWAAKEAAFKALAKLRSGVRFSPRAFEIEPGGVARAWGEDGSLAGAFALRWERAERYVHCVAVGGALERMETERLRVSIARVTEEDESAGESTERERASARSPESRAVRRLAKELARAAGLGDVEIVRDAPSTACARLGPPRLYAVGARVPLERCELSLSHDGDFVAAALYVDVPHG